MLSRLVCNIELSSNISSSVASNKSISANCFYNSSSDWTCFLLAASFFSCFSSSIRLFSCCIYAAVDAIVSCCVSLSYDYLSVVFVVVFHLVVLVFQSHHYPIHMLLHIQHRNIVKIDIAIDNKVNNNLTIDNYY